MFVKCSQKLLNNYERTMFNSIIHKGMRNIRDVRTVYQINAVK